MNPISSTLKALLVYCCMCCYLWISYFYSYINKAGRAGFVMSSQASSAGRDEATVRRKLVESGHVDVMVAIRSNFFYTRTVPCELWFLDKSKSLLPSPTGRGAGGEGAPQARGPDTVLMLDARNVYRKVTRNFPYAEELRSKQGKDIPREPW